MAVNILSLFYSIDYITGSAECLTWDQGAHILCLTGVTVLCPWARHINPSLVLGSTQEDPSLHCWWDEKISNNLKKQGGDVDILLEISPGGGGLLWYFHTYVGSGQFFGFKILNFNILGGVFRRVNIFWGIRTFCGYFLGSSQIWTILRGHFYAF